MEACRRAMRGGRTQWAAAAAKLLAANGSIGVGAMRFGWQEVVGWDVSHSRPSRLSFGSARV